MRRLTGPATRAAETWLRDNDARFGELIATHGPCPLHRGRPDPFNILGWSIINQQLSIQAANTIARRVLALTGEARLSAAALVGARTQRLRSAGLSNAKVRALKELAAAAVSGELNFRSLAQRSDEAVTKALVAQRGIGAWTAQMFLMFALRRADVFSPADIGLQRAAKTLYGLDKRLQGDEFVRFAERWRPYRTVACWYLWRHSD